MNTGWLVITVTHGGVLKKLKHGDLLLHERSVSLCNNKPRTVLVTWTKWTRVVPPTWKWSIVLSFCPFQFQSGSARLLDAQTPHCRRLIDVQMHLAGFTMDAISQSGKGVFWIDCCGSVTRVYELYYNNVKINACWWMASVHIWGGKGLLSQVHATLWAHPNDFAIMMRRNILPKHLASTTLSVESQFLFMTVWVVVKGPPQK